MPAKASPLLIPRPVKGQQLSAAVLSPRRTMHTAAGKAEAGPGFYFGTASASYQVEGAHDVDGRRPSIWDTFCHTPGKTANGDSGDIAIDFYHRYEEDIQSMKELGIQVFRFSISWPRIFPDGSGQVNQAGLDFYSRLIDALLAAGIEPSVTLYHWDLPQALHDRYGGWLSDQIVPDFVAFAEACFSAFGPRVTYWTTFNEPWTFIWMGYSVGAHAPGRGPTCAEGSQQEPWICTHNVLNAHAAAVASFRRLVPHGKISINFNTEWAEPLTDSPADKAAAQRHMDFFLGIYADPVYFGEYPQSVRDRVPCLPHFSDEQRRLLQGSADYFALNYYTSRYVRDGGDNEEGTTSLTERDGQVIGRQADSEWLYSVPWAFRKLMVYIDRRYGHPEMHITENGCSVPKESQLALPEALEDTFRVQYYKDHLAEIEGAKHEDGVDIRGFCAWSWADNLEWADGFDKRFGIVHVDYRNGLKRTPKASAKWLSEYFKGAACGR
ncbi:hypothetical protein WJX72_006306 [[Myrmecia] bisecta]|uniref:Beta-glucosidase n=1 Tax=[Myrmecia] bisecta TaxID=41462 RepID=A0AAW1QS08_9CHLO